MKSKEEILAAKLESARRRKEAEAGLKPLSEETLIMMKKFDFEPIENKPPSIKIPDSEHWKICVVLGQSGTGKTTSLRRFGEVSDVIVPDNIAVIEAATELFDTPVDDTADMFRRCGFSSIPSWCLPYNKLSNGEKYRVQIALKILRGDSLLILDEFGSYLDRTSAEFLANVVKKIARTMDKKFLIATLNPTIAEELEPDELIEIGTPQIRSRLRREKVLQIQRCSNSAWKIFQRHHYLNHDLLSSAKCFLFTYNDEIVGFVAARPLPGVMGYPKAYAGHRVVVLPSFQGSGLGPKMADIVASSAMAHDVPYFTRTIHPSLGHYRNNSELWTGTSTNEKKVPTVHGQMEIKSLGRIAYSHRYVGPANEELKDLWFEPYFDRVENEYMQEEKKDRLISGGLFKIMNNKK